MINTDRVLKLSNKIRVHPCDLWLKITNIHETVNSINYRGK
jgi:hypothetical protein